VTFIVLASSHRSTGWVWAVVAGFAVALALLWHVISSAVGTLPDDIRDRLRQSVRSNARPLVVAAVVLAWTLTYGLYSVAITPTGSSDGTTVAAGATSASGAQDAAGASGDTAAGQGVTDTSVAGAGSGGSGASGGRGKSTSKTATGGTNAASTTVDLGAPTGLAIHDANLYSGAANTRGITASSINICGHAPLIYGQLLNTKKEDLLVFWSWLNDHGGIFGRKFTVDLQDDQYSASASVPAAQKCAEGNPFMIFGALGSDVIPPVRNWAETNKELYLYGFTVKKGSENAKYTYSATISQEELSSMLGDVAVTRFPGKKVGIVWRNSSNFQPGRDAFKKAVTAKGGQVVADLSVQENQGTYSQQVIELQQAGAQVVFILEAADAQLNFIKQAKTQQYSPQWLVFSFNIQTQTLGNDALTPPLLGSNLGPAYECHKYDGPYASYAAEIKTFEEAYAKYSPNTDLCGVAGDVAFGGWVGFKAIAAMFQECGPNCTRNRFAGIMDSGYKATIGAACPIDFSGDAHHGGHLVDLMEAYPVTSSRAGWRNIQRCTHAP
jgi:ABC-type branched-subunit amino acid transport system substrate-binding protein